MRAVELFGCPVHAVTMDGAVAAIEGFIAESKTRQAVFLNAGKFAEMEKDPALARAVKAADLLLADGQSVVWACRFLGHPVPERVAGVDLMQRLLAAGANKGYRFYFLGAREEVVAKAVDASRRQHPGIAIAGYHHGYFTGAEEAAVADAVAKSGADVLFVAMSSPRKELFMERNLARMKVPFAMGVGGSFDVVAGVTRRAPVLMQKMGLEWLFRLMQEPGRMWRRYLFGNTAFVMRTLKERFLPEGAGR